MDTVVRVKHVTTVEVTVSREEIAGALGDAAAEAAVPVDPKRRLIIQLHPKANAEVVGESRVEIALPKPDNPQSLYFDIRPTDLGHAEIWVIVRQDQVPLTTLKLKAKVVKSTSRAPQRVNSETTAAEAAPLEQPLHQLSVYQQQQGGGTSYLYVLEAPSLGIYRRWESKRIVGNVEQYVNNLYRDIEGRWLSSNQDVADFTEELREFGVDLLEQLVPEDMQQVLWDNRDKFESIQVLGDEPFIPWELVHLRAPGKPFPNDTCFLGQIGLVRWLCDGDWPPTELQIRKGRARYVIPDYPDERYKLPETVEEREFLEKTFGATAVEPQPNAVRKVLSTPGTFDLLHFACHGAAETDDITSAEILLEGRVEDGKYLEATLTSTTAEKRSNLKARDGSRPIIVLNACQAGRAGYRLTGIGGFAQAFLRGKAGAFIGTLWSVGDTPARVFTEAFYAKLLEGKKVSEAAVAAREKARTDGDATWLAYVVYAHPHATLTR
jgi:hypothetical protein